MRPTAPALPAIALVCLSGALAAAQPRSPQPAPQRSGPPQVQSVRLSNGLEVLVVEKHDAPLVTIEIAVKTGSFTETPETNGLSHLYEHMFFKGNAALPTQERYMARVSELGISFNGTTSTERVNYFFTLPSRNFAGGMKFMQDALLRPLFNQEELVAERAVVIGEYDRNEADPRHYLREGLREHLYGDQAYRKNPLGERKVILSATQDTMRAFQARYYVPNNSCLLIVGDVNLTEARVLAERLFGPRTWPRGKDPHQLPRLPLPRLSESRSFLTIKDTPLQVLGGVWPGPDVGRDERATFVADVWGTLLSLPHGRFQRTFRDGGLADEVGLSYYTQREGGEISFDALCRDGKLLQVRDTLQAEIAAMAEPGYWSAQDLELAKRTLRIGRAYEGQSGAELSHTLSFWWASSSLDYYRGYLEACGSVSLDELRAFVRNYLVGRPMVLGGLLSGAKQQELGLKAEQLLPKTRASAAAASAVEDFALSNGLRVLYRRQPGATLSAMTLAFDGGSHGLEASQQGIDQLLLGTLLDGSKTLKRDALQARLVGLGARHSSEVGYDYAQLSLAVPRDGFDEALALVGDCLREPAFEPRQVRQRKNGLLADLKSEASDPDRYVTRVVNRIFFEGHTYAMRPDGTAESVAGFDAGALRARLKSLLQTERMLLVVVGDYESRSLKTSLEGAFGFVPRGAWKRQNPSAFAGGDRIAHDPRQLPTNYVLGKCAAPAPGHPDYPAARMALAVLKKRLWASLRTKHSLTYAPWAGIGRYRSNYGAIYASTTQPKRALALTWEEVRGLQNRLVSPLELRGLTAQEETRAYGQSEAPLQHAKSLIQAELVGGSWRSHYELPAALGQVTPKQLQAAARSYLRDFRFGLIGPAELTPADIDPGVDK